MANLHPRAVIFFGDRTTYDTLVLTDYQRRLLQMKQASDVDLMYIKRVTDGLPVSLNRMTTIVNKLHSDLETIRTMGQETRNILRRGNPVHLSAGLNVCTLLIRMEMRTRHSLTEYLTVLENLEEQ